MARKYFTFYPLNTILIILILSIKTGYADKIYTWKDKSGITHFSNEDNGEPGIKSISDTPKNIVKTKTSQSQNNSEANNRGPVSSTSIINQKQNLKDFTLSILKPINNTTIQNSRATTIKVELSGYQSIFASSGYIALNVDNQVNRTFTTGNSFYINTLSRGQHTLKAIAYSANGSKIADSTPVIFYVQNSIARATAGSTRINNTLYENQTSGQNYTDFQDTHNDELINPKTYNAGFFPTTKAYQRQITGK